jgi:hypothetical protein
MRMGSELEQRFDGHQRLQLILIVCLDRAVESFDGPAQLLEGFKTRRFDHYANFAVLEVLLEAVLLGKRLGISCADELRQTILKFGVIFRIDGHGGLRWLLYRRLERGAVEMYHSAHVITARTTNAPTTPSVFCMIPSLELSFPHDELPVLDALDAHGLSGLDRPI